MEINVFLIVRLRLLEEIRIEGVPAIWNSIEPSPSIARDLWVQAKNAPEFSVAACPCECFLRSARPDVLRRVRSSRDTTVHQESWVKCFARRKSRAAFHTDVLESLDALVQCVSRLSLLFGLRRTLCPKHHRRHPRQSQKTNCDT